MPTSPSQWNVPQWNQAQWNQGPLAAAAGKQILPPSFTPILNGVIIPLSNAPNQSLQVTLPTANGSLTLNLQVSFNEVGLWWVMQIYDQSFNIILSDVPLLTGYWPGANILAPYAYTNCGTWYIINNSGGISDWPGVNGWGANAFQLLADCSMVNAPMVNTTEDLS